MSGAIGRGCGKTGEKDTETPTSADKNDDATPEAVKDDSTQTTLEIEKTHPVTGRPQQKMPQSQNLLTIR